MTAERKQSLALFLATLDDLLGSGYASKREYSFSKDPSSSDPPAQPVQEQKEQEPVALHAALKKPVPPDSLHRIINEVYICTACPLHKTRISGVPGEGVEHPVVLVVGEGPGAQEDKTGRPFVGPAGQLLDKMLSSIDLSREKQCFITNIVKCRPPLNRDPQLEEMEACMPFFSRQLALLKPKLILSLGRIATQWLLQTNETITKLHGQWKDYKGIPFLPTYHPSALLHNEMWKRPAWEDLKILRAKLQEYTDQKPELSKQKEPEV
ncbi:MAG: uracil-DNA glycosylase [Spirochaetaceae bacterium]|jgi:DNA polymerase|nr:uracil-DNA glycosylase [Spirochaetaceae bacterium]